MTGLRACLVVVLSFATLGLRGSGGSGPDVSRLAATLRELYAAPQAATERWRRRPRTVRLPDGRDVSREAAHRDDALFPAAAAWLLASPSGDDAALGAWLLGSVPSERAGEAESILAGALEHTDRTAAFEAARALAAGGSPASLPALQRAANGQASPDLRSAAAWAAETLAGRHGIPCTSGDTPRRLKAGFRKGVSWWRSEARDDAGAASFRTLASLGVDWVSIHTWDPLQRGTDDPRLAEAQRRPAINNLDAIVAAAHAAGLRVMVKPHLEMRRYDPSPEDLRVLQGPEGKAGTQAVARLRAQAESRRGQWHNIIEMRSEPDWQEWFRGYGGYVLGYAEQARQAGADMFCIGRELDRTVVLRDGDWRRLIARVRAAFPGPLVYSANFDSYASIRFWDALDYVGISAYFPLSGRPDPDVDELVAGWGPALASLESVSQRFGRPVLLTEVGYPAARGAAGSPWREGTGPPDVWLQARCYEATLRAIADRPRIEGTFWWLWEGTLRPPFRDPSFSIQNKPAAFVIARWFRGL